MKIKINYLNKKQLTINNNGAIICIVFGILHFIYLSLLDSSCKLLFSQKLVNANGNFEVADADKEFEFNVSRYSALSLMKAEHIDELEKDENVIIRIDYKNSGVNRLADTVYFLVKTENLFFGQFFLEQDRTDERHDHGRKIVAQRCRRYCSVFICLKE